LRVALSELAEEYPHAALAQAAAPDGGPAEQQHEVARLMNCLKRYWDAWQGETLPVTTPEPDWDAAPIDQLEQQVDARTRDYERSRGSKNE